eukprot:m.609563 g.609563  ORF g.609563 m.609563 type:complete len:324 (+) comp22490_c0_seq5:1267-2238(+)
MWFMPSSPRWLLMKGRRRAAARALRRFRIVNNNDMADGNSEDIEHELASLADSIREQRDIPVYELLRDPVLRRALYLVTLIVLFQQFTGQPNVLFYGTTIFRECGFSSERQASMINFFMGIIKLLSVVLALRKVDEIGRRTLLLAGTAVMTTCLATLTAVSHWFPVQKVETGGGDNTSTEGPLMTSHGSVSTTALPAEIPSLPPWIRWTMFLCIFVFVAAYAFSFGPVTWLLLSELFPDNIRARAVGVATVVNWSANLTVSATFLSLMETIGFDGTFLIYTCVGVSGVSTQASGRNTSAKAGNCSAACMYYDGFYQVCVCVCG